MNGVRRPELRRPRSALFQVDRRQAGPPDRHARVPRQRRAPGAGATRVEHGRHRRRRQPHRPVLGGARPGPARSRGKTHAAVPDPGLPGDQHQAGRRASQYFNGLAGTENRAWFGQFDHVRGWETDRRAATRYQRRPRRASSTRSCASSTCTSRASSPRSRTPRSRCRTSWAASAPRTAGRPPTRASTRPSCAPAPTRRRLRQRPAAPPRPRASGRSPQPLPHDVVAGGRAGPRPSASSSVPNANLAANVYDIAADGTTTMISRGVHLLRGVGLAHRELRALRPGLADRRRATASAC